MAVVDHEEVASGECAVGALICDVQELPHVFAALQAAAEEIGEPLTRPKAVQPHAGRKAVHLTVKGAGLLLLGRAAPQVQALLDAGRAEFAPGLRCGAQAYRPQGHTEVHVRPPKREPCFTFIELFAGIGGFHVALDALGGACVLSCEIDVDSQEAYAMNFGAQCLVGDVTAIPSEVFPAHDLLTAGFPCQPFARRGDQRSLGSPRGELFFEIVRVLKAQRPSAFLLENVWNLLFMGGGVWAKEKDEQVLGDDFKRILSALEQTGYVVRYKVIDAAGWVPQKRERVYIVGFRDDKAAAALELFEWPEAPGGGVLGDILEKRGSADAEACMLSETQWATIQRSSSWARGGERLRFARLESVAQTLTSSYKSSYQSTSELVRPEDTGLPLPRLFTHRECARLMGFPAEHKLGNPRGINRAYRQLGNAVCPPLVHAVARNLLSSLGIALTCEAIVSVGPVDGPVPPGGAAAPEAGGGLLSLDAAEPRDASEQSSSETGTVGSMVAETAPETNMVLASGDQPPLVAQLMALTVDQMEKRLESLGRPARPLQPFELYFGSGVPELLHKLQPQRKAELVNGLCEAYAEIAGKGRPRIVQRSEGQLLPEAAVAELLETLQMVDWKENRRPGVQSEGYIILKRPCALEARGNRADDGPRWRERDPRNVRRKVWELAEALLAGSAKSRAFDFTNIVVSKNFVGSPHTDQNDRSVQYLLSLGDFVGGGELCVEESAFVVRSLNTKGRLACIDGRFPHWVAGYTGERFSIVFYRIAGFLEPVSHAVHDV